VPERQPNMNPVVTIDLSKNPDVAALVSDMEPSKRVFACFTIKDKDEQTLTLRLSEMAATRDELPKDGDYEDEEEDSDEDDDEAEDETPKPPEKSAGERIAEKMSNATSDY
jgi:hypothetical protein